MLVTKIACCMSVFLLLGPRVAFGSLSDNIPFDLASPACYTLLNATGTIGCRSLHEHGEASPGIIIESAADLVSFVESVQPRRVVLLTPELFTRKNLLELEKSGQCAGVLLEWSDEIPEEYSPDLQYPYCLCEDPSNCGQAWNAAGDGVAAEDFDFPILALTRSASQEVRASVLQSNEFEKSSSSHPQFVVEMDYFMDVYQGYRFSDGAWWQLQPFTQCCSKCTADCGANRCCNSKEGFVCQSLTSTRNAAVREQTCAKRASPTAYSCIEQQTCLPIGGYNIWAIFSRQMPLPPKRRIVMVAAAADSSALFHDLAAGAVANDASVIALIAAATALRGWRDDLEAPGSAVLMMALLQGEAWDHVGSRRHMHTRTSTRVRTHAWTRSTHT